MTEEADKAALEPPPVLSYQSRRPPDRILWVANTIIGLSLPPGLYGCFGLFYLFVSPIADPSMWRMPTGDIIGGIATIGAFWLAFALLFASGRALRRGVRWGGMACLVVLSLIAATLIFLLGAIAVDWYWYPDYPHWILFRILPAAVLIAVLALVGVLLVWTLRFVRHNRGARAA